jgi:hypothetical protein
MAGVYEVMHSAAVNNADEATIAHGANQRVVIRFVVGGRARNSLVDRLELSPDDPLNVCTVYFTEPTTGTVQVLVSDVIDAQAVSPAESAAISQANFTPADPPVKQSDPKPVTVAEKASSQTSSDNWKTALTLTVPSTPGKYMLTWRAMLSCDRSYWGRYAQARLVVDGNEEAQAEAPYRSETFSGALVKDMQGGESVQLQLRRYGSGVAARLDQSQITAWRV